MNISSPTNAVITFSFEDDDDNIIEKGLVTIVIDSFSAVPNTTIGRVIVTTTRTSEGTSTTSTLPLQIAEEEGD